jgi:putative acetyltransferase
MVPLASVHIRRIAAADPAALRLLEQSDEFGASLYPPQSIHSESAEALLNPTVAFFGAYVRDELAACGAVKIIDGRIAYGEIKRVFVDERHRRRGLALALMQRLEAHAAECGVSLIRLETGVKQPEAVRLYRKLGYVERGPFGSYRADPLSVFMEKTLKA